MSPVPAPADRRFRRAHTKPLRRRAPWKVMTGRLIRYGLAGAAGLYAAYGVTGRVMEARLLRVDRIVVEGSHRMSSAGVAAVLDGLRGEHIIGADLESWRQRLLASSWVQDASLRRRLPSTIEVTVSERTPIAAARLDHRLYLVDAEGVLIDEYGPRYAELDLPIVDGLVAPGPDGIPVPDPARAALAARVLAALQVRPDLFQRLSQVDVNDPYNVGLTLANDPAVIAVGHERFLPRLQSYVELASALRARVPDIEHVDLRFEDRIYVRPAAGRSRPRIVSSAHTRRQPGSGR